MFATSSQKDFNFQNSEQLTVFVIVTALGEDQIELIVSELSTTRIVEI